MKLGQLIRTSGLALALAAGLAGCDDDDAAIGDGGARDTAADTTRPDTITTTDTAGDTSRPDTAAPDSGTDTARPDAGTDGADGGGDASSDAVDGSVDGGDAADATVG